MKDKKEVHEKRDNFSCTLLFICLFRRRFLRQLCFGLEAEKIYATSAFGDRSEYKAEVVYGLTRNTALALNYLYQDNRGHDTEESLFSFRVHF